MSAFTCLHCGLAFTETDQNPRTYWMNRRTIITSRADAHQCVEVKIAYCENCGQESVVVRSINGSIGDEAIGKYPNINYTQFPDYVPIAIRSDYQEARQIVELSPKASATLSRRCIQGMIRDRWGVSKSRLADEIDALPDEVPYAHKQALHALRKIGNIGAHMEKDVNLILDVTQEDAEKLCAVVEFLIKEWYVNRHESEELMKTLSEISKK